MKIKGVCFLCFCLVFAVLILPVKALCYEAGVINISGDKYFPAVKQVLSEAEDSIYMAMFKVGLNGYDKSSKIYQLLEELIEAHNRGIKVKVILDQNIGLIGKKNVDEWVVEGKNSWCFKMLKNSGVDVCYDDPAKYLHAKTIIVDREKVILGSANWTESALFRNFETNVLIKSKELAKELLAGFEKIKIDDKASGLITDTPMTQIAKGFLFDGGKMPEKYLTK